MFSLRSSNISLKQYKLILTLTCKNSLTVDQNFDMSSKCVCEGVVNILKKYLKYSAIFWISNIHTNASCMCSFSILFPIQV